MKRYPLPDLLKGMAVFLIVPVHIMETFIDYPGRESLLGKTLLLLGGPIAVPVFMIIMGYFVAKSKRSPQKTVLRGVKVFIVGLLLNIGLNFNLLLKIKFAGWEINPWEYVFGVDILYLAGLSIIVMALLKRVKQYRLWLAIFLVFLISGLTGFMNETLTVTERNYVLPFIAGNYSWAYFPLFPWLTYPLIGFAFFYSEEKIKNFVNRKKIETGIILTTIGVLVISFYKWGISTTINLPAYYHHTFLFSLWAMGVVILWVVFIRLLHHKFPDTIIGKSFQWLGKNITLFYVIQWLIIGNIATQIYQTQSVENYWFWFVGIFSVTVLLTWLIGKTNIKLAR